ncbi:hypothetical protein [Rubrimonas cliftonensis]|uniref:Uncharacterized protein n=1 Tax=Rubrimonas cliftonensis TaxID=89524 RepID=A0A1H4E400_9RHOB|nr:hypothetical protein [Rubrimonas cliftonensis]SEA79636.1 hypothetical protein SAMN05444370_11231 [Rubrimonas cliftonensis]
MAEPARAIPIEPDALLARLHPLRPAAVTTDALVSDVLLAVALGCLVAAALALLVFAPRAARGRDPLKAARKLPPPDRVAAILAAVRDGVRDAGRDGVRDGAPGGAPGGSSWAEAFAVRVGRPAPAALLDARARLYAGDAPPGPAEADAVEEAARAALAALRRAGGRRRRG